MHPFGLDPVKQATCTCRVQSYVSAGHPIAGFEAIIGKTTEELMHILDWSTSVCCIKCICVSQTHSYELYLLDLHSILQTLLLQAQQKQWNVMMARPHPFFQVRRLHWAGISILMQCTC